FPPVAGARCGLRHYRGGLGPGLDPSSSEHSGKRHHAPAGRRGVSTTTPTSTETSVREERKPSLRKAWLVFARRRYDEPLYQVGTVTAEDADMAVLFAQSIYDEHPWIEMIVAPRDQTHTAIAS